MTNLSDEFNLIDIYRIVRKRIKALLFIALVPPFLIVCFTYTLPNVYRSQSVIIPLGPQSSGSMSIASLAAQMGGGLPFLGGGLEAQTATTKLMGLLKSRTVAERTIERFHLKQFYFKDSWDESAGKWKEGGEPSMQKTLVFFNEDLITKPDPSNQFLNVAFQSTDPKLAATIVNGVLEELQKFMNQNEFSDSKRHRLFVGNQLSSTRKAMLESGKELAEYYERNQIPSTSGQINVTVTADIADYSGLSSVPVGVDTAAKVQELEKKRQANEEGLKSYVIQAIPQSIYLQYVTQNKEILTQLTNLLSQQYEMARIQEAKEDLSFQMIDPGQVPERKYSPKRKQILVISLVLFSFLGVSWAFFAEYLERVRLSEIR